MMTDTNLNGINCATASNQKIMQKTHIEFKQRTKIRWKEGRKERKFELKNNIRPLAFHPPPMEKHHNCLENNKQTKHHFYCSVKGCKIMFYNSTTKSTHPTMFYRRHGIDTFPD